ncbi:MAG: hypothetical protein ACI8ZN_001925 [Bacteroidia bacterium]|jgi:hypothetical protein
MKIVKILVIALMLSPLFFVNTGCGDDPVVTPKDTTPTQAEDTAFAGFKMGFDIYALVLDKNQTDAHYESGSNTTKIDVTGYSKAVSGTGIVEGKGIIELTFPGKAAASFDQTKGDIVEMEITTGTPPTLNGYSWDAQSKMKINITEYGDVGGKIKGTFSGVLKTNGIGSITVANGFFEVERSADQ